METVDSRSARKLRPDPGLGAAADAAGPSRRLYAAGETALDRGISYMFGNDDVVDRALTTNLKPRSIASQALADRANAAFSDFSPSGLSAADHARPNYLRPDDDLTESMTTLINTGTEGMRTDPAYRSLRLALSPAFKQLIKEHEEPNGEVLGTVGLRELVTFVTSRPGAGPLTRNPTWTACAAAAEGEAERRLCEAEGSPDRVTASCSDAAYPSAMEAHDAVGAHGATEGPGNADRDKANGDCNAASLVREQVTLQMGTATSPEQQVVFAKRSDQETHSKAVETFELRDGPSDVTSYHDFSNLQIAFEHVWTEVFDNELEALGRNLYQEYVKLKVFADADDGPDRAISTLDDLRWLIEEVRTLSRMTGDNMPTSLAPEVASATVAGEPVDSDALKTAAKVALAAAGAGPLPWLVEAGVEAGVKVFTGKQQITWDSFSGPLPWGDIIEVRIEENVAEPGVVLIALANTPNTSWWKGIEFRELGPDGAVISRFNLSTDPNDSDVDSGSYYNVLPLWTPQVLNAELEFKKAAMAGVPTGFYVLGSLGQKIKDQARVTFTWVKDD